MAAVNLAFRSSGWLRWSSSSSSSSGSKLILLLLTAFPLTLDALAFVLQWRGGLDDPISRWPTQTLPGMESPLCSFPSSSSSVPSSSSDCVEILGRSSSPSFPYYRDCKFDIDPDPRPKICVTTSTTAGLDQILPWIFYHKVIGFTKYFLFVERKAAGCKARHFGGAGINTWFWCSE